MQGSDPAPEEIMSSTYLHSFKVPRDGRQTDNDIRRVISNLAQGCRNLDQMSIFWSLGSRKFNFHVVNSHDEIWYHPPYALEMNSVLCLNQGLEATESHNAIFTSHSLWDTKWIQKSYAWIVIHGLIKCSKWGMFSLVLHSYSREMFFSGNYIVSRF